MRYYIIHFRPDGTYSESWQNWRVLEDEMTGDMLSKFDERSVMIY